MPLVLDWQREDWVTLGNDVWIGHGAMVLLGLTVATWAVVGFGASVSRCVAPCSRPPGSTYP